MSKKKDRQHSIPVKRVRNSKNAASRRDFLKVGGIAAASLATTTTLGAKKAQSVEDVPVVLESAINETRRMPHEPVTVEEHINEMIAMLDAGAAIAHNHSKDFSEDPQKAAQFYAEVYKAIWEKHPHAIVYPTINLDMNILRKDRRALPIGASCAHHRVLAEAGLTNMVMLDTGVSAVSVLEDDGVANNEAYYVYQFWPQDVRYSLQICSDFGCGAAVAVYEPGWMKNVVAMAKAGTLPRGSKLNLFFGDERFGSMAPAIPEALELYLKMMEGLDLKWSVGSPLTDRSIMDTPIARMALERGGSLRVGLEDYTTGPSNLEQLERAKELVASVGRRIIFGAEAIEYLDIPFAATRPL